MYTHIYVYHLSVLTTEVGDAGRGQLAVRLHVQRGQKATGRGRTTPNSVHLRRLLLIRKHGLH